MTLDERQVYLDRTADAISTLRATGVGFISIVVAVMADYDHGEFDMDFEEGRYRLRCGDHPRDFVSRGNARPCRRVNPRRSREDTRTGGDRA